MVVDVSLFWCAPILSFDKLVVPDIPHLVLHHQMVGWLIQENILSELLGEDEQLHDVERAQERSQRLVAYQEHGFLVKLAAFKSKLFFS